MNYEQHFLQNKEKYRTILAKYKMPVSTILEFGSGNGEITSLILDQGYEVIAYEIDPTLETPKHPRLKIINSNFLEENFDFISSDHGIICNPPYSTLEFIAKIIEEKNVPFMLMTSLKKLSFFRNYEIIEKFYGDDFLPCARGEHYLIKGGF